MIKSDVEPIAGKNAKPHNIKFEDTPRNTRLYMILERCIRKVRAYTERRQFSRHFWTGDNCFRKFWSRVKSNENIDGLEYSKLVLVLQKYMYLLNKMLS